MTRLAQPFTDTSGRPVADASFGLIIRGTNEQQLLRGRFAPFERGVTAPDPNGQVQESPQCAGPVRFVPHAETALGPLVPDKTFQACRSAPSPELPKNP